LTKNDFPSAFVRRPVFGGAITESRPSTVFEIHACSAAVGGEPDLDFLSL
jgi:hypothetical protein